MSRPILLAVAVAFTGCAGDPGAPALVIDGEAFGVVPLYWTHPAGEAREGYAVELAVAGGTFQVWKTLGPKDLSVVFVVGPEVPEKSDLQLRIRALPDDSGSRTSNVVRYHYGVMPPTLVCDGKGNVQYCQPSAMGFELQWSLPSRVADRILLQRRSQLLNGDYTGWQTLPASFPATSYLDTDLDTWRQVRLFEYQMNAFSSAGVPEQSDFVTAATISPP